MIRFIRRNTICLIFFSCFLMHAETPQFEIIKDGKFNRSDFLKMTEFYKATEIQTVIMKELRKYKDKNPELFYSIASEAYLSFNQDYIDAFGKESSTLASSSFLQIPACIKKRIELVELFKNYKPKNEIEKLLADRIINYAPDTDLCPWYSSAETDAIPDFIKYQKLEIVFPEQKKTVLIEYLIENENFLTGFIASSEGRDGTRFHYQLKNNVSFFEIKCLTRRKSCRIMTKRDGEVLASIAIIAITTVQ